ncbi:MAG: hypothetical protein IPN43_10340 [Chitinophagaceae bacterium]|nr:hypothetical protein [Chitinophagaceae bacterium]
MKKLPFLFTLHAIVKIMPAIQTIDEVLEAQTGRKRAAPPRVTARVKQGAGKDQNGTTGARKPAKRAKDLAGLRQIEMLKS